MKVFSVVTRCVYDQNQSIQDSAGGNSHTGWIPFINMVIVGLQRGISQHAFLNVHIISCFTVKYLIKKTMERRGDMGQRLVVTLNLCLVHNKVLFIPTVLELFALAAVQTRILIFGLVEGEERRRVAAVTAIS